MKSFATVAAFAASANALVGRGNTCCFHLKASGGASGSIGQLDDGQNRVYGNLPEAQFCIDHNGGGITDSNGRGCVVTGPTTQWQCDAGATATTGFSIDSQGELEFKGSSEFVACQTGQNGGMNLYISPNEADVTGCTKVKLSADSCSGSSGPGSGSSSTLTVSSVPVSSSVPSSSAPSFPQSSAPVASSTPAASSIPVASSTPGYPGAGAVPSGSSPVSPPEASSTPSYPGSGSQPSGSSPAEGSSSYPGIPHQSPPPGAGAESSSAPSTPQQTTVRTTITTTYCPATSSAVVPGGPQSSAPSQPSASPSAPQGSSPAQPSEGGSGSSPSGTPSSSQPSTTPSSGSPSGSCPTDLSGEYNAPHLIIPVSSSSPDTAPGTSYNGTISTDKTSLFNFDVPSSDSGKTCSLVFLFPEQKDLETSAFTFSGDGKIDFAQLSSPVTTKTSYSNMPSVEKDFGTKTVSPGNSYVISTFECPAGQAVSYEMKNAGSTYLDFFEDYNPSPIGLFMPVC